MSHLALYLVRKARYITVRTYRREIAAEIMQGVCFLLFVLC